ncbi:hypothetical protein ACWNG8_13925 [Aeromonas veronii]
MNKVLVAKLIKGKFGFLITPTEDEVSKILAKLSDTTTDSEFETIVLDIVKNTTVFSLESLDMGASKNILLQILQMKKASEQPGE